MGKIEDCFGNADEAQLYGLSAFEQPILRLSFDAASPDIDRPNVATNCVYVRAIAGIVISPDVIEPDNDAIVHPAIQIQPVSNASITVGKDSRRMRQNEEFSINTYDEVHSLLIRSPINEPDEFKTVLEKMTKRSEGALTVSRALPIRAMVKQLGRLRDVYPHARIAHDLTKIALSNIWS